ncbi:hypothetical protein [Acinetobacter sp.]|uniref:hypothetical protein n=1 Tax=Acinetobacter sp. TaxID=472 RepID=UPI003D06F47F
MHYITGNHIVFLNNNLVSVAEAKSGLILKTFGMDKSAASKLNTAIRKEMIQPGDLKIKTVAKQLYLYYRGSRALSIGLSIGRVAKFMQHGIAAVIKDKVNQIGSHDQLVEFWTDLKNYYGGPNPNYETKALPAFESAVNAEIVASLSLRKQQL